jgi:glutamate synthase (NADPH/NADH)
LIDLSVDIKDFHEDLDFLSVALDRICKECEEAVKEGFTILVLSDRNVGKDRLPASAFLALGAVHQFLVDKRIRMKVALVVETGEAREVHHLCFLLGYGADAICPYLVFEIICTPKLNTPKLLNTNLSNEEIFDNYKLALQDGITKVMAKMGICILQSYKGAKKFEAVGINKEVIDKCFSGTASRLGGVTFQLISKEIHNRYLQAYGPDQFLADAPRNCKFRGLLEFSNEKEIDIEEPSEIVKRFVTSANGEVMFKIK